MKKVFNIFIICLLTISLFFLVDNKVSASAPDAYMIVSNPGEDSSVEMNIGWHTALENTASYVVYTKKSDTDWSEQKKVKGTYQKVDVFNGIYSKSPSNENIYEDAVYLDYDVTLTDLDPDTEYMYKVGQNTLSDVQYFKTAGSTTFSFAWISDFHAYDPIPSRLKSAMNMIKKLDEYNNGFDFIFSTGDEIAWGGSYSHWLDIFEENYHKNYMWASVIGNHDYMDRTSTKSCNDFFRSVYSFPTNGYEGEEGVCYYFKYSNVLFITMNNETQTTAAEVKKAQDWFEDVVTKNPAQYIIVAQHYQWFNGITGSFNNSTGYGRWKELFDKYQVDLAFSGNNHIYVRSKSLYQDKVSTDPNYGTTYIQASSSDNERGQAMEDLTYNKNIIAHRFTEGGRTVSGIIVNVTEENIKIELLDRNGVLQDSVVIKARRDVYPMNNFDKAKFEQNIKVYNDYDNDKNVIKFSDSGIGYVDKIEVLYNNISASTNLKKDIDTLLTINDLPKDQIVELDVKITYKDQTSSVVKVKVNTKKIIGKLTNYKVSIVDDGYKINFDNTYTDLDEIKVYLNNQLMLSNNGNSLEALIKIEKSKMDISDKILIETIKDGVVISSQELNYYSSVDVNRDGFEDKNDILFMQEMICLSLSEGDEMVEYLDINNDGFLDIKDATYLAMYIDGKIETPIKKQFIVEFINGNGQTIKKVVVDSLDDVIIEAPTYEGYTFIGWDKEYSNVTGNIVVHAIYSKN